MARVYSIDELKNLRPEGKLDKAHWDLSTSTLKMGSSGVASPPTGGVDQKELLGKFARESLDLDKFSYRDRSDWIFDADYLECKHCLTMHSDNATYHAHTQGRKHQTTLARLASKQQKGGHTGMGSDFVLPVDKEEAGKPSFQNSTSDDEDFHIVDESKACGLELVTPKLTFHEDRQHQKSIQPSQLETTSEPVVLESGSEIESLRSTFECDSVPESWVNEPTTTELEGQLHEKSELAKKLFFRLQKTETDLSDLKLQHKQLQQEYEKQWTHPSLALAQDQSLRATEENRNLKMSLEAFSEKNKTLLRDNIIFQNFAYKVAEEESSKASCYCQIGNEDTSTEAGPISVLKAEVRSLFRQIAEIKEPRNIDRDTLEKLKRPLFGAELRYVELNKLSQGIRAAQQRIATLENPQIPALEGQEKTFECLNKLQENFTDLEAQLGQKGESRNDIIEAINDVVAKINHIIEDVNRITAVINAKYEVLSTAHKELKVEQQTVQETQKIVERQKSDLEQQIYDLKHAAAKEIGQARQAINKEVLEYIKAQTQLADLKARNDQLELVRIPEFIKQRNKLEEKLRLAEEAHTRECNTTLSTKYHLLSEAHSKLELDYRRLSGETVRSSLPTTPTFRNSTKSSISRLKEMSRQGSCRIPMR